MTISFSVVQSPLFYRAVHLKNNICLPSIQEKSDYTVLVTDKDWSHWMVHTGDPTKCAFRGHLFSWPFPVCLVLQHPSFENGASCNFLWMVEQNTINIRLASWWHLGTVIRILDWYIPKFLFMCGKQN